MHLSHLSERDSHSATQVFPRKNVRESMPRYRAIERAIHSSSLSENAEAVSQACECGSLTTSRIDMRNSPPTALGDGDRVAIGPERNALRAVGAECITGVNERHRRTTMH